MDHKILPLLFIATSCFGAIAFEDLSLEEQVGQVLMVHFRGETANEDAKTLIHEAHVGGIIYYNWANGLTSPTQVQTLSSGLQRLAQKTPKAIPLLIAADQEGGLVARLQSGFTQFPGNRALGETGDPSLAEKAAFAMGEELRAVGIQMSLSPVVDVNMNPRNPVIGIRSFGDDPEVVTRFGEHALRGFQKAGILATVKHFPGHGDTTVDSHEDLPVIDKSFAELEKGEFVPFAHLVTAAETVMTAHLMVPALDPDHCSTLSAKTLHFLRDALKFKGLIVTDSLVMEGVLKKCGSVDEAAIQALNAGCDLLILGGRSLNSNRVGSELTTADVIRVHRNLVAAVKSGRISKERLHDAVDKILALKERYLPDDEGSLANVYTEAHRNLAKEIASRALKTTGSPVSLSGQNVLIVAPSLLKSTIEQTSMFQIATPYYFEGLNPLNSEEAIRQAEFADAIVVCSNNAWKNPGAKELTDALCKSGKPVIVLCLRDPLDGALFPEASCVMTSFSPTVASIQAICDQLDIRDLL